MRVSDRGTDVIVYVTRLEARAYLARFPDSCVAGEQVFRFTKATGAVIDRPYAIGPAVPAVNAMQADAWAHVQEMMR